MLHASRRNAGSDDVRKTSCSGVLAELQVLSWLKVTSFELLAVQLRPLISECRQPLRVWSRFCSPQNLVWLVCSDLVSESSSMHGQLLGKVPVSNILDHHDQLAGQAAEAVFLRRPQL